MLRSQCVPRVRARYLVMWDFVVGKVALGQVFSEYFGFPCQSSFDQLLHNHPHVSSGACTKARSGRSTWGLSPTPQKKSMWTA
jgi:hypothetical protein